MFLAPTNKHTNQQFSQDVSEKKFVVPKKHWWDSEIIEYSAYEFDEITSTQDIARNLLEKNIHLNGWGCVRANRQQKGMGQFGKSWISLPGGLYVTFFCPWPRTTEPLLSLVSALSVIDSLPIHGQIKWINDIIINEKKLSGVLSEILFIKNTPWCIIGIGINVNIDNNKLMCCHTPAESLKNLGYGADLMTLWKKLKESLYCRLKALALDERQYLVNDVNEKLLNLGESVYVQTANGWFYGIFLGIDCSGNVLLDGHRKYHAIRLAKNLDTFPTPLVIPTEC